VRLATRAFIRLVLTQYADLRPSELRFRSNPYGKPEIDLPKSARILRFNLSHTRGLLVGAVTCGREVGVDVEAIDRMVDIEAIANRFFSTTEKVALQSLSVPERRQRFFEYWTLKEAFVKARGEGLSLPLDGFAFVKLDNEGITIKFDPILHEEPGNWHFALFQAELGHLIAVALRRRPDEEGADWRTAVEITSKPFVDGRHGGAAAEKRYTVGAEGEVVALARGLLPDPQQSTCSGPAE
jgi:4'-phosphopantetheinyl transferase